MQLERSANAPSLRPLPPRTVCSIIIPCYNEERFIDAVLRAATMQDYPADKLEILVVDGGSADNTRALVRERMRRDPRIQLIDNPHRLQAAAMNIGIRRCRGDVIVRMDAHAEYATNYVSASVDALRSTGAFNVGGAARPLYRSYFQRAVCAALRSPLGV